MSIVRQADVFCDGAQCSLWTEGGGTSRAKVARANAHAEGWVTVRRCGRLVDFCPGCRKQESR